MSPPLFQRRTLGWLVSISLISLGFAFYFMVNDPGYGPRSTTSTNTYSDSAIGHSAFKRLLRRLNYRVSVSGHNSASKIGRSGILILAEPTARIDKDEDLVDLLSASRILVVLPKRSGFLKTRNPRWLAHAPLLPVQGINKVLDALGIKGIIHRDGGEGYSINQFGISPGLIEPQLIRGSNLTPLIARNGDILIGELLTATQYIMVVSDPDILANHGLDEEANAALMIGVVNRLRGTLGSIVFDEAIHGFKVTPSLWVAVFNPPFLSATILGLMACAVILWSALGRFGPPEKLPPALAPGKDGLIANTANLLLYGGRTGNILERYLASLRQEVCARLHAPSNAGERSLADWLDRVGKQRHVTASYDDVAGKIEALAKLDRIGQRAWSRHLDAARKAYQWKQEMLNDT